MTPKNSSQGTAISAALIRTSPDAYHATLGGDVPTPFIHRCTLLGIAITEAASLDHHVIESIVIFVLRVPASSTQQSVTEREETSEVHTEISQRDQI